MTVLFIRANRISPVAENKQPPSFVIVLVLLLVIDLFSFSSTSTITKF